MKKILFALSLCLLPSCKFGCATEDVVSKGLASGIALALQCQNQAQIQTDILNILSKTHLCSEQPQGKTGPIANVVCPILANEAVSLLGNVVPASWECNPALAQNGLAMVITKACEILPF